MAWSGGLRRASGGFQRPYPARAAHQVRLPHALEFAFVCQQVQDSFRRLGGEQARDGFPEIKHSFGQWAIWKNRRVKMPLRLCAGTDGAEKRSMIGLRLAFGKAGDEDEVP